MRGDPFCLCTRRRSTLPLLPSLGGRWHGEAVTDEGLCVSCYLVSVHFLFARAKRKWTKRESTPGEGISLSPFPWTPSFKRQRRGLRPSFDPPCSRTGTGLFLLNAAAGAAISRPPSSRRSDPCGRPFLTGRRGIAALRRRGRGASLPRPARAKRKWTLTGSQKTGSARREKKRKPAACGICPNCEFSALRRAKRLTKQGLDDILALEKEECQHSGRSSAKAFEGKAVWS